MATCHVLPMYVWAFVFNKVRRKKTTLRTHPSWNEKPHMHSGQLVSNIGRCTTMRHDDLLAYTLDARGALASLLVAQPHAGETASNINKTSEGCELLMWIVSPIHLPLSWSSQSVVPGIQWWKVHLLKCCISVQFWGNGCLLENFNVRLYTSTPLYFRAFI